MTRSEKNTAIADLKEKFSNSSFFYLTDASTMTVEETSQLRRLLFNQGIEMRVVKNTLAKKALESIEGDNNYGDLFESLRGPTAVLFTEVANSP
ncbi:MAG: 50S ribosomal protein L10, partial [Saprospiraceae bacterium]